MFDSQTRSAVLYFLRLVVQNTLFHPQFPELLLYTLPLYLPLRIYSSVKHCRTIIPSPSDNLPLASLSSHNLHMIKLHTTKPEFHPFTLSIPLRSR